jgi:hypothetical protein
MNRPYAQQKRGCKVRSVTAARRVPPSRVGQALSVAPPWAPVDRGHGRLSPVLHLGVDEA